MKLGTQIVVVLIMAAAGFGAWQYREHIPFLASEGAADDSRGAPRTVGVDVAPVRTSSISRTANAVGTARANEAITVTSKVTAIIERISFEEGELVDAGATLVTLDSSQIEAELEQANADLLNTQQLYDRARELLKSRNVPQARVDELAAGMRIAEAKVTAKEAELADYVIRAPFAGRLGLRMVSQGALIQPGTTITTLDDVSVIKLDFDVPETLLDGIEPGLEVEANSAAYQDRIYTGIVSAIDSRIDQTTRAARVRALVPNADRSLKPGMFLTVTITLGVKENALLIPAEAVLRTSSGAYVFTVEDGRAVRTSIQIGQRLPDEVEVTSGLEPGDIVVRTGLQKIRDGLPVRPLDGSGDGQARATS